MNDEQLLVKLQDLSKQLDGIRAMVSSLLQEVGLDINELDCLARGFEIPASSDITSKAPGYIVLQAGTYYPNFGCITSEDVIYRRIDREGVNGKGV